MENGEKRKSKGQLRRPHLCFTCTLGENTEGAEAVIIKEIVGEIVLLFPSLVKRPTKGPNDFHESSSRRHHEKLDKARGGRQDTKGSQEKQEGYSQRSAIQNSRSSRLLTRSLETHVLNT